MEGGLKVRVKGERGLKKNGGCSCQDGWRLQPQIFREIRVKEGSRREQRGKGKMKGENWGGAATVFLCF